MFRASQKSIFFLLAICLALPTLALAQTLQMGIGTFRISVASDGTEGNGLSYRGRMSNDGRWIIFTSFATNFVPGDTNNRQDVFLHDRQTASTELVSLGTGGNQANHESISGDISATGRYITFISAATNLVPNDTNGMVDVFWKDLDTNTTERISVSTSGSQANGGPPNHQSGISANGRWVVFASDATNLVESDTNGKSDIFLRDRVTGTTTRISVSSTGAQANEASGYPGISDDGRFIAYDSGASNLVSGDTNAASDIFLYDRVTQTTTRISVNGNETQGNGASSLPKISSSGDYIVFESDADNLVPTDSNDRQDVFLYERNTGELERVSVNSSGTQGNQISQLANVNADGRYVVFRSDANNLVPGDTNNVTDAFLHDRQTGQTSRMSVASAGTQANAATWFSPEISSDGMMVSFDSSASNLVPNDTNFVCDIDGNGTFEENCIDVFIREWTEASITPTPSATIPNATATATTTTIPTPTSTPTPTLLPPSSGRLYLPLIGQRYQPFACIHADIEPNNASASALQQDPLCQNITVDGALPTNDPGDYYRIVLTSPAAVTIDLFDIATGGDFDLYLYDAVLAERASSRTNGNANERITLELSQGTYYVRVYPDPTEPGGNRTYRLKWAR